MGKAFSSSEIRFETLTSAIVLSIYFANRFFGAFDGTLPQPFLDYHFGDLCAGVLFPAYANLVTMLAKSNFRFDNAAKILALSVLCSISWEVVAPVALPNSTGDILDVIVYIAGSFVYLAARLLWVHSPPNSLR